MARHEAANLMQKALRRLACVRWANTAFQSPKTPSDGLVESWKPLFPCAQWSLGSLALCPTAG